ncbi:MAG: hypothetical protein ABI723_14735 [Bacteroidia bacterium]
MKNNKRSKIGLWLDHAEARIINPDKNAGIVKSIHSTVESRVRIAGESGDGTRLGNNRSSNNESQKHHREQNQVHAYYKQLAQEVMPYDDILIFGPTTAPQEFHNYLNSEKDCTGKRIKVEHTDYITDNQLTEQVHNFFEQPIKA